MSSSVQVSKPQSFKIGSNVDVQIKSYSYGHVSMELKVHSNYGEVIKISIGVHGSADSQDYGYVFSSYYYAYSHRGTGSDKLRDLMGAVGAKNFILAADKQADQKEANQKDLYEAYRGIIVDVLKSVISKIHSVYDSVVAKLYALNESVAAVHAKTGSLDAQDIDSVVQKIASYEAYRNKLTETYYDLKEILNNNIESLPIEFNKPEDEAEWPGVISKISGTLRGKSKT